MAYVLRQARQSAWSGDAIVDEERRGQARASFARRPVDTDGISVYCVSDEAQVLLVVAALACAKKEDGKMDLLHIDDADVARFGTVKLESGTTPVSAANKLHGVLDWSSDKLGQLADHLLSVGTKARRHSPQAVRSALAALDADDVESGEHRDWLLQKRATYQPA